MTLHLATVAALCSTPLDPDNRGALVGFRDVPSPLGGVYLAAGAIVLPPLDDDPAPADAYAALTFLCRACGATQTLRVETFTRLDDDHATYLSWVTA
jgi:hypothetical protein